MKKHNTLHYKEIIHTSTQGDQKYHHTLIAKS